MICYVAFGGEASNRCSFTVAKYACVVVGCFFECCVDVDERAVHCFIDTVGPECAVEMRPTIDVH